MQFKEKVVVITGSSQGIGKAMAEYFCQEGARVMLNARNVDKLNNTLIDLEKKGFEVAACPGDISVWEDICKLRDHTITTFGKIDVLINNAATTTVGLVEEVAPHIYDRVIRVNLLGPTLAARAFIPEIKKSQGSIVFISTIASLYGLPYHAAYSLTKRGLSALAESLRSELKPANVHTGIAYVGFTENDPSKKIYNTNGDEIVLPQRAGVKRDTPERVALKVGEMIAGRRSRIVLSAQGKLVWFLHKFAPGLLH